MSSSASPTPNAAPAASAVSDAARYRALVEQAPVAVHVLDAAGRTVSVNPAFERMFGVSAAEMAGYNVVDDPRPAADGTRALLAHALAGEATRTPPFRPDPEVERRTGRASWIEVAAHPVRDAAGRVAEVVLLTTDVTVRVESERVLADRNAELEAQQRELELAHQQTQEQAAELEEANDLLRRTAARQAAVLAQLAEGVVVTDTAGRITIVNEAAARLHGVSRLDVTPEAYADTYHLFTEDGRPYPSTELPLARAVRGQTVNDARWRIHRPDGTAALAVGSARPVRDGDGRQAGAVLTFRDDTERAAAAARSAALLAVSTALVAAATPDDVARVVVAEGCRALGATRGAVGLLADDVVTVVAAEGYSDEANVRYRHVPLATPFPLTDAARDGRPVLCETAAARVARYPHLAALRAENGEGAMAAVPLPAPGGGALGAMAFNFPTDRTFPLADRAFLTTLAQQCAQAVERARLLEAERAAREAAEAASRVKSQFLATMSHELRTPLNAISGYVQLLEMGIHGPVTPAQLEALGRVARAQRHLLGLINDVLTHARLEGGRVAYDVRPVDLRDVLADAAPLVEPQMAAKRIAFDVRLPAPGAYQALADPDKLAQILVNLLANAAKFTPAGGRVTMEVATRDGGEGGGRPELVFVRVADTGVGIPRDQQDAVFEPFVQARGGHARPYEGTGLGLTISRDLARGMGGEVRMRSAEGEGSTFTVALRRAAAGQPNG